jgi:hypothetical protein
MGAVTLRGTSVARELRLVVSGGRRGVDGPAIAPGEQRPIDDQGKAGGVMAELLLNIGERSPASISRLAAPEPPS